LGAGLDTFALRNPYDLEGARVFEVDHPETQHSKRSRMRESGVVEPGS
jgi:O-methyltransferase involved in polyketide biosynthesis